MLTVKSHQVGGLSHKCDHSSLGHKIVKFVYDVQRTKKNIKTYEKVVTKNIQNPISLNKFKQVIHIS